MVVALFLLMLDISVVQTGSAVTLQSSYGYWSNAGPNSPTCLWPNPLDYSSTVVRYGILVVLDLAQ